MQPSQRERQALADLFLKVGPDAPTLCEGWRARDLAAHLVLRERRPDASLGMVVPLLSSYTARVQRSVRDGQPWEHLVERVRTGPPFPLSLPPLDSMVNTVEYFVHHEDVRRGAPHWTVRTLDRDLADALWSRLGLMARVLVLRAPVGVLLEAPGRAPVTAKGKEPTVKVAGEPGELVLWAFGRQQSADVRVDGDRDAIAKLSKTRLGL
jgi:uncharacterized protein (TIGR03085 family)